MSGKIFLDSNVLVYVFDEDSPSKQRIAQRILRRAGTAGGYTLSTQVLQEFYVSVTRKLARPLPHRAAFEATRNLAQLHLVQVDGQMIFQAIELSQKHALSFWDALILEAARGSGCRALLTEELQDGWTLDGLTVENPFSKAG